MNKYYTITATLNGELETLFGSFDKSDCTSTLECDKAGWKEEGYKGFKIAHTLTTEAPDAEIYGEWATGAPQAAIAAIYAKYVEGEEMTCDGNEMISDIYAISSDDMGATVTVNFEDEQMAELISGNVSCRIYDAIEAELAALGYEITDTNGTLLHLTRNA